MTSISKNFWGSPYIPLGRTPRLIPFGFTRIATYVLKHYRAQINTAYLMQQGIVMFFEYLKCCKVTDSCKSGIECYESRLLSSDQQRLFVGQVQHC